MAIENINIIGGSGISVSENNNAYTISADSSATLLNDIDNIEAATVQDALTAIAQKLTTVEGIIGGAVVKALADGSDPEYPESNNLLENGLYIRLETTSGKRIYISAYEIDKAIAIIGDMTAGKADIADLEAIEIELAAKASSTQVALMQYDIDSRATKDYVDSLSSVVDTKADKTTVDSLSSVVDTKADKTTVDSLSSVVDTKADKTTVEMLSADVDSKAKSTVVEKLKSDVEALKNTLDALSDNTTIVSIKKQIKYLNDEINKRLTIDDVIRIEEDIVENAEKISDIDLRIDSLEDAVSLKANKTYVQSQVTELNGAITAMSTRVNAKADKKDVALKANQTDMDIVVRKLSELQLSTESDFNELEQCCKIVQETLKNKASKTYVDNAVGVLNAAINTKADSSETDENFVRLNNKINTVESTAETSINNLSSDVYELECELNNELAELRATIDMHERNIVNNADNITKLQEADYKYEQTMKNEWVRVMTPEAYNRLAPIGTSYEDGTLDPYAKQANVIYMIVRYNKPIAVYIGDILIAQAEQKGPQGFVYNFPIIF